MNYKYAFIFLMTFVVVFVVTKIVRENSSIKKWFSKQTSIRFEQRSLDFGTVSSQKAAHAYFVFTNSGSNDLKIENIDTRCGCTATDWPTSIVKPHQKDSILVQYDAVEEGFFLKEIYVFSNSETSPDLLTIKGTVVSASSHTD
ncbi:MAG: DUF1573 domain-containing protein [Cyclobacteriaceae bacterium]|nr:DUF1573 domain-containing protein [Cyclobacteriaceae bacterium]